MLGELRSDKLCGIAKKKKKRKENLLTGSSGVGEL